MGRWSCLFIKRNSNPTLYQFFLSDSNFYCSHLLRSDFSRWINFWEKNNLLFHRFVPSFLCDLIISRFFIKNNWQNNWIFKTFFVQWGELCFKNKIGALHEKIFVIYYKCWGLVEALFFVFVVFCLKSAGLNIQILICRVVSFVNRELPPSFSCENATSLSKGGKVSFHWIICYIVNS